jgi:hypothetical protein
MAAGAERSQWLKTRLGELYPADAANHEIIEDVVTRELNGASFTPTFFCPRCGRMALGPTGTENSWRFYSPEPPAGGAG